MVQFICASFEYPRSYTSMYITFNAMGMKLIFLIFCIAAVFILLLTISKTDFINGTVRVESKDLYQLNYRDTNIFSIVKLMVEAKCEFSFIVWIVTSSANDHSYRTASRRAYPNEILRSLNITRIFLLGIPKVANEQKHILEESLEYNDLLQGDFLEDYRNLTQKHLMGLKWTTNNCRGPFIMKSDDDIALDIFEISRFLQRKPIKENTISGYALRKMKPVRVANNKWFVSRQEFPGDIYPDFLSGWLYVTSLDVAKLLVSASRKLNNFFWIDDVFITGILRQECGIEFEDLKSMYATDYRYLECCIRGAKKRLKCEFIAGPDGGKKELHMKFREFSQFCQRNCSERTEEQSVLKTCVSAYEERISAVNSTAEIHYV